MKTSYIFLTLSLILIAGVVSLGGMNFNQNTNDSYVQYELKLPSEKQTMDQTKDLELQSETFIEEQLDIEIWMTDLSTWN